MSRWPYSTAAWQRLRAAKLSADPLCEACIRREVIEPANTVDHIIAINKGGDPFPTLDQLMSLCTPCHNIKTNAIDHPSASGHRRALKGFDVEGNPIDPEGWERTSGPRWQSRGLSGDPGGFKSRESATTGPARYSNKDLVSYGTNKEADRWA